MLCNINLRDAVQWILCARLFSTLRFVVKYSENFF